MKSFLIIIVAIIAVVSGAALPVPFDRDLEIVIAQNELVQLIREDLYILRKILNDYEPVLIPYIPEQHIEGKDINIDIDLKEVKMFPTDNFTVDYTKKNQRGEGIDFGFTIPKVHIEGQYKVSGVVRQARVNGDGNFTADIDELVLTGTIQLTNDKPYPKVKAIDVKYDLKGLKIKLGGLSIEGTMKEEMTDLVNTTFYEYLQSLDLYDSVSQQLELAVSETLQVLNLIDAYSKLFPAH